MKPKNCLQTLAPLLKKSSFTSKESRALDVSSATLAHHLKTLKNENLQCENAISK